MPSHLETIPPCPHLPQIDAPVRAASMKQFGKQNRGPAFYEQALVCAQSLWRQGFPAQAILQLNRGFGADLKGDESILISHPLPYQAMFWILKNHQAECFIGNPRRHFQHYATRMNEPRREQRVWRAWACWYLACAVESPEWVADEKQIREENITEPTRPEILSGLRQHGITGEAELWEKIAGDQG